MIRGKCATCGVTKTQFVKKSTTGGDLAASFSAATSNIKLPWAKYPGEMHLPGMNFAGLGTNLNERLSSTGAYKDWSKQSRHCCLPSRLGLPAFSRHCYEECCR